MEDSVTGLIWEVKTADDGLHDKADRYNWYNTNNSTNGGADGDNGAASNSCEGYIGEITTTWCNTQAFTARVNAVGLCGATDWRLPTITELKGIVNNGGVNPSIDTLYFPNTESTNYWSSSPYASDGGRAWLVGFNNGDGGYGNRNSNNRVRLVRSGQ